VRLPAKSRKPRPRMKARAIAPATTFQLPSMTSEVGFCPWRQRSPWAVQGGAPKPPRFSN
jgi:hypothetical protein